jgi:hypothetical protein
MARAAAARLERKRREGGGGQPPIFSEVILHYRVPAGEPEKIKAHRRAAFVLSAVGANAAVIIQEEGEAGSHFVYRWDDIEWIEAVPSRLEAGTLSS